MADATSPSGSNIESRATSDVTFANDSEPGILFTCCRHQVIARGNLRHLQVVFIQRQALLPCCQFINASASWRHNEIALRYRRSAAGKRCASCYAAHEKRDGLSRFRRAVSLARLRWRFSAHATLPCASVEFRESRQSAHRCAMAGAYEKAPHIEENAARSSVSSIVFCPLLVDIHGFVKQRTAATSRCVTRSSAPLYRESDSSRRYPADVLNSRTLPPAGVLPSAPACSPLPHVCRRR